MEKQKKTLKIVVVGDGAVGKYIMNISNKERHRHRQCDRIMEPLVTLQSHSSSAVSVCQLRFVSKLAEHFLLFEDLHAIFCTLPEAFSSLCQNNHIVHKISPAPSQSLAVIRGV